MTPLHIVFSIIDWHFKNLYPSMMLYNDLLFTVLKTNFRV